MVALHVDGPDLPPGVEGSALDLLRHAREVRDRLRGNVTPVVRRPEITTSEVTSAIPDAPAQIKVDPSPAVVPAGKCGPKADLSLLDRLCVSDCNRAAIAGARLWAGSRTFRMLFIVGPHGSGRTALLEAACAARKGALAYDNAERRKGLGGALKSVPQRPIIATSSVPIGAMDSEAAEGLSGALMVSLHAPDVSLQWAVAERLVRDHGATIPANVIGAAVEASGADLRLITGIIGSLLPMAADGAEVGQTDLAAVLRGMDRSPAGGRDITMRQIMDAVCRVWPVSQTEIRSPRRAQHIMAPRHAAALLGRDLTTRSYAEIGRAIGGRDHTTIIHAARSAVRRAEQDPYFAEKLLRARAILIQEAAE